MKRAVILHGTDASPDMNWFPWLSDKLTSKGYDVWTPQLPDCHVPNLVTYANFIFDSGFDLRDSLIIGHSSGAVEVLNLLMDERCPKIKAAVCVGAWEHGVPEGMASSQFQYLFPESGFDFPTIKHKAAHIEFLHGDDDPYCPLKQAEHLASELKAPITIVPGGHHLGSKYIELPEVWQIVAKYL